MPYLQLLAEKGLPLVSRHLPLMGYWLAESGELNVIHHLWSYDDWAAREAARLALSAEKEWVQDFIPEAFAMVEAQENCFMRLTAGSKNFEDALAKRHRSNGLNHSCTNLFMPQCAALIEGDACEEAVACFAPISGAGPARCLLPASSDPLAYQIAGRTHTVLRPLAFSPL